jgi:hypothetical protein
MPAISYSDWSGGLDRRLSVNSQDANKLWTLRNAYITTGKRLKKRPGLRLLASGLTGSFGLKSVNGALNVFCDTGGGVHGADRHGPDDHPAESGHPGRRRRLGLDARPHLLRRPVPELPVRGGAVCQRADPPPLPGRGHDLHHRRELPAHGRRHQGGQPDLRAERENVRYCAAGAARDWTTASDAGFLAAGLQQDTKGAVKACGTFQDSLVVLFEDSAQIWNVAVDPAGQRDQQALYGIGTEEPLSLASFFSDLVFLSPVRLPVHDRAGADGPHRRQRRRRADRPAGARRHRDMDALADAGKVRGYWITELGQYWAVFDMGTYSKVWAYTFSRSSKIACWSEYTSPA